MGWESPAVQLESTGLAGRMETCFGVPGSGTQGGWAGQATFSSHPEGSRDTEGFPHREIPPVTFGKIPKDWKCQRGGKKPPRKLRPHPIEGGEAGRDRAEEWADGEDPGLAPQGWTGGQGRESLESRCSRGAHPPYAVHPLMTPWAKPQARNPSLLGPAAPSA